MKLGSKRRYNQLSGNTQNIYSIYKIQLNLKNCSNCQLSTNFQANKQFNEAVRIDQSIQKQKRWTWTDINERDQFGYEVMPESPINYFNDQDDLYNNYTFDDQIKSKYYSWELAQTNEETY